VSLTHTIEEMQNVSDIKIRKADMDDLPGVTQLFDLYRIFYGKDSDILQAKVFLAERIKAEESEIYIAENDKKEMVGFMQLYPLFSSTRMRKLWLLNDLYVIENYRGKGISKKLIDRAKQRAMENQACGIMLETAKTNNIGNQLYPATGFHLEEDSNFYFWTNK
jgi:ribosomal protein S18 acetylase RimI-like enzyme